MLKIILEGWKASNGFVVTNPQNLLRDFGRQATGLYIQTPKLRFGLPAWKEIFLRPFLSLRSICCWKYKKAIVIKRLLFYYLFFFGLLFFKFSKRFFNASFVSVSISCSSACSFPNQSGSSFVFRF